MPSRGLIHSRTIEQVLKNVTGHKVTFFLSHDLPLPDSFNDVVGRALKAPVSHIWLVEDDIKLPPDILSKMLALDKPLVSVDSPMVVNKSTVRRQNGYTLTGTGCMLIKAEVFKALGEPYFRSVARDASTLKVLKVPMRWGGQDYDFCIRAHDAGFPLMLFDEPAGQYRVTEYGDHENNHGWHKIIEWDL